MKLFILTLLLGVTFGTTNASAQFGFLFPKNQTAFIEVAGNCGMCKQRIERAALIKGVKLAQWDKNQQSVKVIFSSRKTSVETIEKAIAASGHDTKTCSAPDAVYSELPGCCQYRDGINVH